MAPVSGWLSIVPLLQMLSLNVGQSKCSYRLSEMSYLYDLEIPETSVILNRILLETATNVFKPHKTGTVPGKPERMGSPLIRISSPYIIRTVHLKLSIPVRTYYHTFLLTSLNTLLLK
jgi:hypothetical protein